jgi:hypothetical protein
MAEVSMPPHLPLHHAMHLSRLTSTSACSAGRADGADLVEVVGAVLTTSGCKVADVAGVVDCHAGR